MDCERLYEMVVLKGAAGRKAHPVLTSLAGVGDSWYFAFVRSVAVARPHLGDTTPS